MFLFPNGEAYGYPIQNRLNLGLEGDRPDQYFDRTSSNFCTPGVGSTLLIRIATSKSGLGKTMETMGKKPGSEAHVSY